MPAYVFICPACSTYREVIRLMKDSGQPEICECGQEMVRNYKAEQIGGRGMYAEPIVSESMAFDAIDLAEHRKRFPDIDVVVEGRIARPILRSLSQKRQYLKRRGWIDTNSFI